MVKVREDMTGWNMWEHGVPGSRLTVIEQVEDYITPSGKHHAQWLCKCKCGNKVIVRGSYLNNGHVISCGCYNRELINKLHRKYNEYNIIGNYIIGYTSKGEEFYFDLEDYDKVKNYCWDVDSVTKYVRTRLKTGQKISMHKLLFPEAEIIDHKNRNRQDNRKSNLRLCTSRENMMNKSVYKNNTSGLIGVRWHKQHKKWCSEIGFDNRRIHLGYYDDKEDAIHARLEAEVKYYGEFAPQQHLFEKYGIDNEVIYAKEMECEI